MDNDTRTRLGLEGTRIIREIEDALDTAIALHGELVSFLPRARKDAGLSAVFGQALFDHASDVLGDLTQARRRLVATHRSAQAAGRVVGWMDPPTDSKPDNFPIDMAAGANLRVVAAADQAA